MGDRSTSDRQESCWVQLGFQVKFKLDGTIERYKTKLVDQVFTKTFGIDYDETFTPVAKLNSVRVLISLATNLDWKLHQMDVKIVFLNGELDEEIYMRSPLVLEKEKKRKCVS